MKVFIISVICIPDVSPAIIVDRIIESSTFILHRHRANKQIIEIITGLNSIDNIMLAQVFQLFLMILLFVVQKA